MILTGSDPRAGVGMRAGWALTFAEEAPLGAGAPVLGPLTSDSYDATIEASLPAGLGGGLYTVTVEGLSDADHAALAGREPGSTVMRLHLFWYDLGGVGGYLANAFGVTSLTGSPSAADLADRLVAVLTVTGVRRQAGARRYETVLTARERVFERLSAIVEASVCVAGPKGAVDVAAQRVGIAVEYHDGFDANGQLPAQDTTGAPLGDAMATFTRGSTYRREVEEVATAVERASGRYGRGTAVVRDGVLHLGVRTGPVGGGDPVPLTPSTGLVEVAGVAADAGRAAGEGARVRRSIVCKGRPDLKPGEVVVIDVPPPERPPTTAAAIGAAVVGSLGLSGPLFPGLSNEIEHPQLVYVESVTHRLGRTTGFVTTVTGVEVAGTTPDELYDRPPVGGPPPTGAGTGASGEPAERAAQAVRRGVAEALRARRAVEAGQVRAATSEGDGSTDTPPRHTETVWRGLADPDGRANRLARLPVRTDQPDIRERVPRLTPFAWGRTGLVLPRYPGTRVLLAHGQGEADDPVDIGTLWEAGGGPDAQAGDWWLILPVGVPTADRASVADDATPEPHTGKVSQDLIDAQGNRVIEVGELTVRVGRDSLGDAGVRPERSADDGAVTITHADARSSIVMLADGTVRITASRIELNAGDGDIVMNAANVDVTVTGAMDVSS